MDKDYHIISTLVEDKPGVLQKVAGLFNRRGFNIDSITVGESEVEGLSRMVITVHADKKGLEQVTKQLNKVVDVINLLYKYPAISTSIVAEEADIPPVTATRYLNALEECRIVYSDKRPKNRTYYYYGVLEIIR